MKELDELVELAEKADAVANLMDGVNPHKILAIADAFLALEQRAEAAERERDEAVMLRLEVSGGLSSATIRYEKAEAKLAELEKQEPAAYRWEGKKTGEICYDGIKPLGVYSQPLFTRPAPAVSLAELVPEERFRYQESDYDDGHTNGWNACRAEMLRKIEEAK